MGCLPFCHDWATVQSASVLQIKRCIRRNFSAMDMIRWNWYGFIKEAKKENKLYHREICFRCRKEKDNISPMRERVQKEWAVHKKRAELITEVKREHRNVL